MPYFQQTELIPQKILIKVSNYHQLLLMRAKKKLKNMKNYGLEKINIKNCT